MIICEVRRHHEEYIPVPWRIEGASVKQSSVQEMQGPTVDVTLHNYFVYLGMILCQRLVSTAVLKRNLKFFFFFFGSLLTVNQRNKDVTYGCFSTQIRLKHARTQKPFLTFFVEAAPQLEFWHIQDLDSWWVYKCFTVTHMHLLSFVYFLKQALKLT